MEDDMVNRELESLRREFNAGLTTAGVQIGAVEKTLVAKIGTLKAWGVAALLGGQALAGLMSALVTRNVTSPLHAVAVAGHALAAALH